MLPPIDVCGINSITWCYVMPFTFCCMYARHTGLTHCYCLTTWSRLSWPAIWLPFWHTLCIFSFGLISGSNVAFQKRPSQSGPSKSRTKPTRHKGILLLCFAALAFIVSSVLHHHYFCFPASYINTIMLSVGPSASVRPMELACMWAPRDSHSDWDHILLYFFNSPNKFSNHFNQR